MLPWDEADYREAQADRGAVRCDCCGALIRRGELEYRLDVGKTCLTVCEDCKGEMISSVVVHGEE